MSTRHGQTRPPAAMLFLLTLLTLVQVSCSSDLPDGFGRFTPRINFDLEEMFRELYSEEELSFIEWCSDALEARRK